LPSAAFTGSGFLSLLSACTGGITAGALPGASVFAGFAGASIFSAVLTGGAVMGFSAFPFFSGSGGFLSGAGGPCFCPSCAGCFAS